MGQASCGLGLYQEGLLVIFQAPEHSERGPMLGRPGSKDSEVPKIKEQTAIFKPGNNNLKTHHTQTYTVLHFRAVRMQQFCRRPEKPGL